jgi:hypothetical protein
METFTETKPRRDAKKDKPRPKTGGHRGGQKKPSEDVNMAEPAQEKFSQQRKPKYQPKVTAPA